MQKADVVTTAIVITGMVGVYALIAKYARMQNDLVVVPTASVHSLSLKTLTLRLDLLLKNPTAGSLKIKFPFVEIHYKDELIGSSKAVNKDITIPTYGDAVIEKIMIDIPVLSSLGTIKQLLTAIVKKQPVKIVVKAKTGIVTGISDLSIEKSQEIALGN